MTIAKPMFALIAASAAFGLAACGAKAEAPAA